LSSKIRQTFYRQEKNNKAAFAFEFLAAISVILLGLKLSGVVSVPLAPAAMIVAMSVVAIYAMWRYQVLVNLVKKLDSYYELMVGHLTKSPSFLIRNSPLLILIALLFLIWLFSYPELTYWNILLFRVRNKLKETVEILSIIYIGLGVWFNRHKLSLNLKESVSNKDKIWHHILIILTCLAVGLALRLPKLDYLDPYTDEYAHLNTAKRLVEQNWQLKEYYSRSYYLVTVPVAIGFEILGISLFNARLVGVIINLLALIPLYLIGRKINKYFGFVVCILYATNPWLIATSRTVREYAYFPIIFFTIFLTFLNFLESLPKRIDISNDRKKIFSKQNLYRLLTLTLFIVYGLKINPDSTFKIVYLFYVIGWMFFMFRLNLKNKRNIIFLIGQAMLLLWIFFKVMPGRSFVNFLPTLDKYWWGFFYPKTGVQWYGGRWEYLAYLVSSVALYYSFKKSKSLLPKLASSSFVFYLYFYLFHFDRYHRPRYLTSAQLWYVLFFGLGIYLILVLISHVKNKLIALLLLTLIILNVFSLRHLILPITNERHGYVPITGEYHDKVDMLADYLKRNAQQEYDVCYGTMGSFLVWNNFDFCNDNLYFQYRTDNLYTSLEKITSEYSTGIILLDFRRGTYWTSSSLPQEDFEINNILIKHLGTFDGNQVYEFGY